MHPFGKEVARAIHAGLSTLVKSKAAVMATSSPQSSLAAVVRKTIGDGPRLHAKMLAEGIGKECHEAVNQYHSGKDDSARLKSEFTLLPPPVGIATGLAAASTHELILAGALDQSRSVRHPVGDEDDRLAFAVARGIAGVTRRA